jgi:hypothetical protein
MRATAREETSRSLDCPLAKAARTDSMSDPEVYN